MSSPVSNNRVRNYLLIALFIFSTFFAAFHEGYLESISLPFFLILIAGFMVSIWLARSISTRRLLALIFAIFIIEYAKETIGMKSGMWKYHGVGGQYIFGVWAWVLGGLVAYTASTRLIIRKVRNIKLFLPRWLNPVILILIFLVMLLSLGRYRSGAGFSFFSFYGLLLAVGIYVAARMDIHVFAGIVVTSWLVGNPSEYVGSALSGVWTFTHNPNYPPFFLLFGCWPLEILAQYSLSAYLADEPLDKDTF